MLLLLGWQGLLSIYAIAPFFMGFMAVWYLRGIGRVRPDEPAPVELSVRIEMTKRLLRSPLLWGLTVVRGFRGMALVALVMALSLYLEKELGLGELERGFHIGLLIAIGLVAKPAAGYLSDRFGRKQVLVPGLVWSCLVALALIIFHQGVLFTVTVALLGLFLYPDQPILNAALFDVVGRDVASTGLGVAACASFLMGATAPLIAGALYDNIGFHAAVYFIAGLFAASAVAFAALPLRRPSP